MVGLIIKIFGITLGLFSILSSVCLIKNKKNSLTFAFSWLIIGILVVFLSLVINPDNWIKIVSKKTLIVIFILVAALWLFIWYTTKYIDSLMRHNKNIDMQIANLYDENRALKLMLNQEMSNQVASNMQLYTSLDYIENSNILFVINTLGSGGAEVQLLHLMDKLLKNGNSIDLFVITGQGELASKLPYKVNLINDKYDAVSVLDSEGQALLRKKCLYVVFSKLRLFKYSMYWLVSIAKMVQAGNVYKDKLMWLPYSDFCKPINKLYDYSIAFTEGAATYFVSRKTQATNKFAFVHIAYDTAGYNDYIDNGTYVNINKIFAVSNEVRKSFIRVHPECAYKTYIVENELNGKKIIELSKKFKPNFHNKNTIVSSGRLTKQKDFSICVEAAKILDEQNINFKWIVLGDGPEFNSLQKQINNSKLQDKFILQGPVENPYPYYKNAKIFVHATCFEGKSIALREAKALGCPCVVSDVEGNRETILDGADGLLCKLEPMDIAQKIMLLLNNDDLYKTIKRNITSNE